MEKKGTLKREGDQKTILIPLGTKVGAVHVVLVQKTRNWQIHPPPFGSKSQVFPEISFEGSPIPRYIHKRVPTLLATLYEGCQVTSTAF